MDGPKKPVFRAVLFALSLLCLAAVLVLKETITVQGFLWIPYGTRAYGSARNACIAAAVSTGCLLAAGIVKYVRYVPPPPERPEVPDRKALTEEIRNKLYAELRSFADGKWKSMAEISVLLSQLDSMDEYQAELGRLLEQEDYLKEKPAEIVQRVEDCMYVNVRKLLNYMRIVQRKSPQVMSEKIRECADKNADLLKKTDDFVVAVVGYVNGDMAPGEEEKTKDYVDSYMFVVLRAIELPETYLR